MYEHKKEKMVDNKHVKHDGKGGIDRVMQKKGDLCKGQGGKMGEHSHKDGFKRSDSASTPRKG